MSRDFADDADREQRLHEVLLEYVEEAQAGRAPDRRRLLAAHADLRPELEEFFASHDQVERLAAPFRAAIKEGPAGEALVHGSDAGRGLGLGTAPGAGAPGGACELGQLGDFRLLREVGRGGMGVVYEAEQISLQRPVALKVLPFAAAIDPRQLQRFRNEALAAAHLRHENIVPVFAVGSERGVHYYAMQFIEGQSLATLIAEMRRLSGQPDSSQVARAADTTGPYVPGGAPATLPHDADRLAAVAISTERAASSRRYFQRVAGLARQAALALEHAHQTGIVHRDIKPGNLLLDSRGQLWVTDFGLAQVSGEAGLTVTGELLGTLRYASPEQALGRRGVVDHRSDVYSLGVTLYELLTLKPIFDGRDRHDLLRQIVDEDPRLPRSIDRTIPVELETIVLKAVAKEPAERYATAQELADDLQRFLEDQPIRARRPSLVEKGRKWARRHKSMVASAVAALVLSVSFATVLTLQAYDRERQKAEEADEQRIRAEESFRQAREAVDAFAQIAEEEPASNPGAQALRRRLLEAALTYYQAFLDQHRDEPSIQADLESSRSKVQAILGELATLMGAWKFIPLRQENVQRHLKLSPEQRKAIADADQNWGKLFQDFGRLSDEERVQRGLALGREQEKVAKLLDAKQQARFQQIAIQFLGPKAFSDADVAKALRLTTEQKRKIRGLVSVPSGPGEKKGGPKKGGSFPPFGRPDEVKKFAQDQIQTVLLTVLTPEQRKKWDELVGEPFAGEFRRDPMWFLSPGMPDRPPPGSGPHDRPRGKGPGQGRGPGGRGGP
jgi:serine/threonine protein kinase